MTWFKVPRIDPDGARPEIRHAVSPWIRLEEADREGRVTKSRDFALRAVFETAHRNGRYAQE